jgi:cytochrome P450
VVIGVKRLNRHPSLWGSDGSKFRPERFLDMPPSQWRNGMIRYGIAVGRCLGKNVADLILKMTTLAILETYQLKQVAGSTKEDSERKIPPLVKVEFVKLDRNVESV